MDQTRTDGPPPAASAGAAATRSIGQAVTAPVLLGVFMVSIILAVSFNVGGLRLSPVRIVILVAFVPVVLKLLSGQIGKPIAADYLFAFFAIWIVISIVAKDGIGRLPFSVISGIELLGGYLLGRYLIRSARDFRSMINWHMLLLAVMAPFAVMEFITGTEYWARMLDTVGDVVYRSAAARPRLGFERVLGGFEHPILFGVFCSMAAANVFFVWRPSLVRALGGAGFATLMTFLSLSAGAVLSIMLQVGMVVWNWLTKGNWKLLCILTISVFVFLSIASNRGPAVLLIETLTFDSSTGWTRLVQWEYVSADVMRSPLLGHGLERPYQRPAWLFTGSIDSLWLVVAYRHGLPGISALILALGLIIARIVRAKGLSEEAALMRTGYMIVLTGVMFSVTTVHIWDASAVYFYFYIGAGLWFAEAGARADTAPPSDTLAPDSTSRYSRFAPKQGRTVSLEASASPPSRHRL